MPKGTQKLVTRKFRKPSKLIREQEKRKHMNKRKMKIPKPKNSPLPNIQFSDDDSSEDDSQWVVKAIRGYKLNKSMSANYFFSDTN